MKYHSIVDIAISHPYYTDGRCRALRVVPSQAGMVLLRRYRLLVKHRPDGIQILAPADGVQLLAGEVVEPAPLCFEMRVVDPDFHLFTDTSAIMTMATPVFSNATGTGPLTSGVLALSDHGAGAKRSQGLDLYARIEIAGLPTLASDGQLASFDISLQPRYAHWVYYLVTDVPLGAGTGEFGIVDAEPAAKGAPVAFSTDRMRDLIAGPDDNDPIATELAARHAGTRQLRFVSDEPVASSARGRKNLELRLDGNLARESLPNPGLRTFTRIAPDSSTLNAWTCVIEYRANALVAP